MTTATSEQDFSFAAEFTNKKFVCNEDKLGFVYENRRIVKVAPGLWGERSGLRVDDIIEQVQDPKKRDEFLDFAALNPQAKLLALKQARPVCFIVSRKVKEDDLNAAAVKMQSVYRGNKDRQSMSLYKSSSQNDKFGKGNASAPPGFLRGGDSPPKPIKKGAPEQEARGLFDYLMCMCTNKSKDYIDESGELAVTRKS